MALQYDYTNVTSFNKDMKDEEHENASMFAWQLMAIDVQEVTEKNLEEIVFRLLFLDRMGFGTLVQKHAKRPDSSKAWLDSLELRNYVRTMIGYKTNVGNLSRAKFMRRWLKAFERSVEEKL